MDPDCTFTESLWTPLWTTWIHRLQTPGPTGLETSKSNALTTGHKPSHLEWSEEQTVVTDAGSGERSSELTEGRRGASGSI